MTLEEAVTQMKECVEIGNTNNYLEDGQCLGPDIEQAHIQADAVLARFLLDNGYQELLDVYNEVPKWYA